MHLDVFNTLYFIKKCYFTYQQTLVNILFTFIYVNIFNASL